MSSLGIQIFDAVPPLRPILASARGYYLKRWRYGRDAERAAEAALAREHWTAQRWQTWQREQLAQVLSRAARRVPYYRAQWAERRRRGDRSSPEILENWPILEKDAVRTAPSAFVADDRDIRRMHAETTSGTTGQPMRLWFSKETSRAWYALCEARFRRWNNVSRHDRWALLGAQLVAPVRQTHPPFWVWNSGLNQLYMSAYHVSPATTVAYLDALRKYKVRYLWGHSSGLETLAREAIRIGYDDIDLAVVLSSSEPLTLRQRDFIGQAFRCPVRETYGMTEIAAGASECGHGRLHVWPEVAWLELADVQENESGSLAGDVISTGFLNKDMPLVRYRIGDRAAFNSLQRCSCGRSLPVLEDVEGRTSDTLVTSSGRRIGPSAMEIVFDTNLAIREAQVIQETLERIRVRYVPAEGFTPAMAQCMADRVRARMGDVDVELESVSSIARHANSKFRAVICLLPAQIGAAATPMVDLQAAAATKAGLPQ